MTSHTVHTYPDLAKTGRKDALVPEPLEYDLTDPKTDRSKARAECRTAAGRLGLYERLTQSEVVECVKLSEAS